MDNHEPYLACPHCLAEITTQENPPTAETKPTVTAETLKTTEDNVQDEKTAQQPTTPQCTHHFGYLSERSSKEKISDECIACAEIVNCMLKAMKPQQGSQHQKHHPV
jgi:RAB protein geranylgeranyltransferase component A